MRKFILILTLSMLFASVLYAGSEKALEQGKDSQVIYRAQSQKSFKGPENLFTGDVQVDMLFPSNETAHYSGAYVTFQPGARTAWHFHPAGQHMIVTSGVGLTGTRDEKSLNSRRVTLSGARPTSITGMVPRLTHP